jgi:MFS superfamily sulfate permease-like transporter
MIIAQSAATWRLYATMFKERVDENADILGIARANAAAAVSGAFVVNGSPTQTAMALRQVHAARSCSSLSPLLCLSCFCFHWPVAVSAAFAC